MSRNGRATSWSGRRIAIFAPSMSGGGGERTMLNLAHGIADRDYDVDLVLAQATGPYLANVRPTVRIVDLKASRVLRSLPSLVRYLRREQPRVMLSALDYANITALWARTLAGQPEKMFVSEQNTISRSARNSNRRRQRVVPWLARHYYPRADCVVAVSKGVADDLSQALSVPDEKIQVIHNPVVTADMRQKANQAPDHPWFEPGQPPVVLAIGRLTVQKDFPTLIRAFAQLPKERPARLMILGEGEDRPMLEALAGELGLEQDVALPGFVDNPYAYLSQAELFALSSRWEGLPTVLIEALFCGTPIIATDCPSGPREILAGGEFGSLVPLNDPAALARAMQDGLAGKTPRPTTESWQPYTLESVVNQYITLFER